MYKIINLNKQRKIIYSAYRGRTNMKIKDICDEIKKQNEIKYVYTYEKIVDIADKILNAVDFYSGHGATPIVKISKLFDFVTYKESLDDGKSGDIRINGDTEKLYGHDKIILVNEMDEFYHQRFVVAHELAHYLFDFLGNSKYCDKNIIFSDTYQKNHHESEQEQRANIFAAEIMMPQKLFIEQYNVAQAENGSHIFIVEYLSRFFETTVDSVEKRIMEVFF